MTSNISSSQKIRKSQLLKRITKSKLLTRIKSQKKNLKKYRKIALSISYQSSTDAMDILYTLNVLFSWKENRLGMKPISILKWRSHRERIGRHVTTRLKSQTQIYFICTTVWLPLQNHVCRGWNGGTRMKISLCQTLTQEFVIWITRMAMVEV